MHAQLPIPVVSCAFSYRSLTNLAPFTLSGTQSTQLKEPWPAAAAAAAAAAEAGSQARQHGTDFEWDCVARERCSNVSVQCSTACCVLPQYVPVLLPLHTETRYGQSNIVDRYLACQLLTSMLQYLLRLCYMTSLTRPL
jgi:hypothetical protein